MVSMDLSLLNVTQICHEPSLVCAVKEWTCRQLYWIKRLVSVLSCSCSSTTQWRDWGQVWEAWMISNPTLSLPEWTGSNRRCALWDCGNQSWMLGDCLSWMNPFQTGHTNRYTVNMHFCTHHPFFGHWVSFFFATKQYYLPCKLLISLSHRGFTV